VGVNVLFYEDALPALRFHPGDSAATGCIAGAVAEVCYGGLLDGISAELILRPIGGFRRVIDDFYQ